MQVKHYSPGTWSADEVGKVLRKAFLLHRGGSSPVANQVVWVEKLATYADVFVAVSDLDECLGVCFAYCNDVNTKRIYISYIAKLDKSQKGIGTALVHSLEAYGRERGFLQIALEVRKDNLSARAFYQRMGFIYESENDFSLFLVKQL